eukprot:TRINITY_DN32021_c0_g1_i2.p1 TRINITY_DN32021_c0_g1~~TRINITY_DN32021_c0_g1_i2.p1  ORF type:complete len:125 (-),score=15.68 TRINITY_DN32021_c0_g1_i2:113-487(-)
MALRLCTDRVLRHPHTRRAVVLLNTPFTSPPPKLFWELWQASELRLCADGGANRLYGLDPGGERALPHVIKGDLDSVDPEVAGFYSGKGVSVISDQDQSTNDLDKCLKHLQSCLLYTSPSPRDS